MGGGGGSSLEGMATNARFLEDPGKVGLGYDSWCFRCLLTLAHRDL